MLCWFAVLWLSLLCYAKPEEKASVVELTAKNITSNLYDWNYDVAVMFYTPWCKYCKQLLPSWQEISKLMKGNKNLIVGKLNCEFNSESESLCRQLQVDRYPSVFYIGYGNFNQQQKGHLFGKVTRPNVARFVSDLYPDAIYEWIKMLSSISGWQRRWDGLIGIFTGKSRHLLKYNRLKEVVDNLDAKVQLFSTELEKYKANELFDNLTQHEDPFPILHALQPDENNLPLRMCVADMALEYCKYNADVEPFCVNMKSCAKKELEPEICRPKECPFIKERGLKLVSNCMSKEIIKEYVSVYGSSLQKKNVSLKEQDNSKTASIDENDDYSDDTKLEEPEIIESI